MAGLWQGPQKAGSRFQNLLKPDFAVNALSSIEFQRELMTAG